MNIKHTNKMKKILVINGHPDPESFGKSMFDAYVNAATDAGAEVKTIVINDLSFNPNLQFGYRKRTELEPDLLDSWDKILWADHLVWIYPIWWASMPAILKGFIDRVFLPGFAFKKRENSLLWDKLLKGKSARIITTLDQPVWYYFLVFRSPSYFAMKNCTLKFCGINPVRTTTIGPIRLSTVKFRDKWIERIRNLGTLMK